MARTPKPSSKRVFRMYVDGKWIESESGQTFDVVSPASGDVIGTLPKGTADDTKAAVEVAVRTQVRFEPCPSRNAPGSASGLRKRSADP